jgi:hypothetical protein
MIRDEDGYIVVETVGTFIPFLLLVISILSLVNIVTLQARVHYALTQAANTLSMYSYVLKATGAADDLMSMDSKANTTKENINAVFNGIESLAGNVFSGNNESNPLSSASDLLSNPKELVQLIANYGLSELKNHAIAEVLILPLVERYLANGEVTGSEYLRSVRVINFDLGDSVIVDRNGNIKLTAEYEIEYTFGVLPLPFRPTLRVTQTVVTKAWLGGSGEGYKT